jgi:hypothetical protein
MKTARSLFVVRRRGFLRQLITPGGLESRGFVLLLIGFHSFDSNVGHLIRARQEHLDFIRRNHIEESSAQSEWRIHLRR